MKALLLLGFTLLVAMFFACSRKSEIPPQYAEDNENFKKSIILLAESRDLSNPPGSENEDSFSLPKQTEEKIFSKIEEGIRLGKQVSDEYLDYLHPEVKVKFKGKLIKGAESYFDEIKDNNSGRIAEGLKKQVQGNRLVIEWINWWDKNGERIAHKVDRK